MNFNILISAVFASFIIVGGCSSGDGNGGGAGGTAGSGGTAGVGGGGGGGGMTPTEINCDTDLPDPSSYVVDEVFDNVPPTATDDCTGEVFMPGANNAQRLNALLSEQANPGDVICLAPGTYQMEATINIALVGEDPVTGDPLVLKGTGESPDDTLLVFGGPGTGRGIFVQSDGVTVENLWVKNTGFNGIEQDGTERSTFRKVHVSWDDFCDQAIAPDNCGQTCDCQGAFAPANCGQACDCQGPFAPANCGQACTEDVDCDDARLTCDGDTCVPNEGTYCDDDRLTCTDDVCAPNPETYCDDPLLTCGDDNTCVGDQGKNGPYGIYPTNCEDTTVEYSQATDASDAGIYIGKCGWLDEDSTGGVVRYNIVANSVAGLEVENCLDVVAHDNLVFGNTGGLLPLQQPISAERPANTGVLMENNRVYCNNGENFAETGVVQIIPVGTGLLSLGGQGVEIRNNDIQGNDSLALAVVSSAFTCDAAGEDCAPFSYDYNPYAETIYAHDNFILNNGTNADTEGQFGAVFLLFGIGTLEMPTEDVLWDGIINPDASDPEVCLGADFDGTYRDLTGNACRGDGENQVPLIQYIQCLTTNSTNDTTGRLCDLD